MNQYYDKATKLWPWDWGTTLSTSRLSNTEYKQKIPVFISNPNLIFLKKGKELSYIYHVKFSNILLYKQMPTQLAPKIFKVFLRTKRME